ncbi:MAG: HigA family addiction module antitoxin [Burkholderiaceae bacterium]
MTINRNDLRHIDFSDVTTGNAVTSATPGQILKTEFLNPLEITQYRLAKSIDVPPQRIGAIISHGRAITADTDLRLCHFFKLSDGFFLRLQAQHDLEIARASLGNALAHLPCYEEVLRAA